MPLTFAIDEAHHLLVVTGHDDVTIDDAFRVGDAIRADPRWKPGMHTLADLRHARIVGKTHALWRLATRAHDLSPKLGSASKGALVTSDLVVFGVARMYALLASNDRMEFMAFKGLVEARRFLGLPPDDIGISAGLGGH